MTLDEALLTWKLTPHELVANAIDQLTAEALTTFAAPKARKKAEFQTAWLALAKTPDSVAIGWLANTLTSKMEVASEYFGLLDPQYWKKKYASWLERIDALQPYADDPRVSRALCALFEEMPMSVLDFGSTSAVYEPAAHMLSRSRDPRVRPRLEALLRSPRATKAVGREVSQALLEPVVDVLSRLPPVTLADDERWSRYRVAERPVRAAPVDEAQLREQVLARPGDAALLQVYADALLERGDPRGDFIAAQLDGSAAAVKRANALLRKHVGTWLGPLKVVLKGLRFERGFLVEAELAQNAVATEAVWAEACSHPELATLEVLKKGRGSSEHLNGFLAGGLLRRLRSVEVGSLEGLGLIGQYAATLHELSFPERAGPKRLAALRSAGLRLESLQVSLADEGGAPWAAALREAGMLSTLRHLTMRVNYAHADRSLLALDCDVWGGPLETLSVWGAMLEARLIRSAEGFKLTCSPWMAEQAAAFLKRTALPLIEVCCDTDERWKGEVLIAAAERRGVTLSPYPLD